ncbi:MAG TPA: DUF2335 domain-containing protein [Gemmataceae bacterium]|nr:DUF2335 domain-containing protein [Gemmataceae bacterium]
MSKEKDKKAKQQDEPHHALVEGRKDPDDLQTSASELVLRQQVAQLIASSWAGPLPHPDVFRKYEELMPGLANRLVAMAEAQAHHRMELEKKALGSDVGRSQQGLWAGLAVAVLSIVLGFVCILTGHDWAGTVISTGVIVALVGVFIYGTTSRTRERERKREAMTGTAPDEAANAPSPSP